MLLIESFNEALEMAKNVIKPQTMKIYYKLLNICRLYHDAYITLVIGGLLSYFYECDIKPTEFWELVEAKHSGIWAETTYQKKTIKMLTQGVLGGSSQGVLQWGSCPSWYLKFMH